MLANLTEVSLSEGLLEDDVQKGVHHVVVLHFGRCQLLAREILLGLPVNNDFIVNTLEESINNDGLR